jgi:hypothetical protein
MQLHKFDSKSWSFGRSALLWLAPATMAILACACSGQGRETDGEPDEFSDNLVVGDEAAAKSVRVKTDRLELPAVGNAALLRQLQQGRKYIASGRDHLGSKTNPYGFLRKVDSFSVDSGTIVIETSQATLGEVVKNAAYRPEPIAVRTGDVNAQSLIGPLGEQTIDLSGQPLFDETVAGVHVNGKIKTGKFSIAPDVDVDVNVGGFSIREFHFVVKGTTKADFDVDLSASGAINKSFEKTFFAREFSAGSIGPVQLAVRIDVKVVCDINAGGTFHAIPGADANVTFSAGTKYANGDWTWVKSFDPTIAPKFEYAGPGSANTGCTAGPVVTLMIADSAGPSLDIKPYAKADAKDQPLQANLEVGLKAHLGGAVHVLGFTLVDLDQTLIDKKFVDVTWPQ